MHQVLSLNIPTLSTFQEHAIPPLPNPWVTFSDNLETCRNFMWLFIYLFIFFLNIFIYIVRINFASSVTSLFQTQIILRLKVVEDKYASLSADGGFATPRPGFSHFHSTFEILRASWHALLPRQLFIMMSGLFS